MIDKSKLFKLGSWPNSNYFNSLWIASESKENYLKMIGIDIDSHDILNIDDASYYPLESYKKERAIIAKNPRKSLELWNKSCLEKIKSIKEYSESKSKENYENYSVEDLLSSLKKINREISEEMVFWSSYIPLADEIEDYIIKNVKEIRFEEVRPIKKVSAEIINDKLLEKDVNFDKMEEDFSWYGLQMLRGSLLTAKDFEEMEKDAKKTKEIIISKDQLIKELQLFMWLKFERIDICSYVLYKLLSLFNEIFKRIKLDKKYWEVLTYKELEEALEKNKVPKKTELDSRFEYRGIIKINDQIKALDVEEWKKLKELFLEEKNNSAEMKGKIACKGKAVGKVKVVRNSKEITKVEKGDILITSETLVQYEPWMRKTAGMVIEVNSLLSHSAIFAREFKIPTILGIKNATLVFKDGDLVEVDAGKGIVKIIKRA